jgi:hypothetical protein
MVATFEESYPYPVGQKMAAWDRQIGDIGIKLERKDIPSNKRGSLNFHLENLHKKMADAISGFPS